ncbi:hypothetical protein AALB_1351 [Agarivorans albus MKT 106]|uniref:Uncharacterized protein n=1 Tax=Agarivorans albus MKT 106 TaxID=1331007 RepID=R9PSU3_AGAAL|nr:hypothetical protein AALB_1351 [Agarivorans albus MKT 106]
MQLNKYELPVQHFLYSQLMFPIEMDDLYLSLCLFHILSLIVDK